MRKIDVSESQKDFANRADVVNEDIKVDVTPVIGVPSVKIRMSGMGAIISFYDDMDRVERCLCTAVMIGFIISLTVYVPTIVGSMMQSQDVYPGAVPVIDSEVQGKVAFLLSPSRVKRGWVDCGNPLMHFECKKYVDTRSFPQRNKKRLIATSSSTTTGGGGTILARKRKLFIAIGICVVIAAGVVLWFTLGEDELTKEDMDD